MTVWYDRLKASIIAARVPVDNYAQLDDEFELGRNLNEHLRACAFAIRATGDSFFLEEIYDLWLLTKADLDDSYCEGATGLYSSPDGYDNWRWREDAGLTDFYCMDEHTMDGLMHAGTLAHTAYCFDMNRQLDEKFGTEADFIVDHLENHYLAKWYSRDGTTGTPEVSWQANNGVYRRFTHPSMQQMRLAWYLWQLTGKVFYFDRWTTMAATLGTSHMEVNSVDASGYEWQHEISGSPVGVQEMTYCRYYMGGAIEMWMEGMDWTFNDESELTKVMIGFREAVFKKFSSPWSNMAETIDGGGVQSFNFYGLTALIRWDGFESGELNTIAEAKYVEDVTGVHAAGGALAAFTDRLFKHSSTQVRERVREYSRAT